MNNKDKIKLLKENNKIRNELYKLGICPIMGPTGPRGLTGDIGPKGDIGPTGPKGNDLQILGAYSTYDELVKEHPVGNVGDTYLVDTVLYIWDDTKKEWSKSGNIQGPIGISEKIEVNSTITSEPDTEAMVIDNFKNNIHSLDFIIPKGVKGDIGPKGEKGDKGEQGIKGDTGPIGPRGLPGEIGISQVITIDGTETLEPDEFAEVQDDFDNNIHHLTFYIPRGEQGESGLSIYDAVIITTYEDSLVSGALNIDTDKIMPFDASTFDLPNTTDIDINETGDYEITLSGKISGVTTSAGGIFYLARKDGSVLNNLSFKLENGDISDMNFSGTTIININTPTTLQVKTDIIGDTTQTRISFEYISLVIKKFSE